MTSTSSRFRQVLLVALVIASMIVLTPGSAHACSCIQTSLANEADSLDYAFTGRLVDRMVNDNIADNGVRLVFEVERAYKGDVTTPFVAFTHAQESACGASFSLGNSVAVVAREWNGVVNTNFCDQVMNVGEAGLIAQFGEGVPPAVAEGDGLPLWIVLLGGALIVGSGALVFGVRRSEGN